MSDMPEIKAPVAVKTDEPYYPYIRDEKRLARSWATPGTKGLEHTIGGLEKTIKGTVSYIPGNHEKMVKLRAEKIQRVQEKVPDLKVYGDAEGDLLVVGWGGTFGHLLTSVREMQAEGKKVSLAHFNYIMPFPKNVREVFLKFKRIVVCELNLGQFANYLRMNYQEFRYDQINKVQGIPFTNNEIIEQCTKLLEDK
jgi:2-oxoglutarate ferredoxin oxidoreductase subunit alpha